MTMDEDNGRDYDEDEEERDGDGDEEGDGRQMLGFMFGNVDDSGGLDEEYLDQDAKEHLSALAHQLGPSFVDIEQLYAKRKKVADAVGGEEQEDYDQKAEDAVDYEDIQETYEGPEVQFAQQELQFYADAALAGPIKLADDDNYDDDEDNDYESEPVEEVLITKQAVEDEDFDSEQPQLESDVKNVSELEKDNNNVSMVHAQCLTSGVDMMASDEDEDDKEDWDQILGSQDTSSSKEQKEEEISKISLPVLCQEDGKTVLRFSELFGAKEPYWIIGHRKGREKRGYTRERRYRAEEDLEAMEDDEGSVLMSCSQQAVHTADSSDAERDFESGSVSDESQVENGVEAPSSLYTRYNRTKQRSVAFTAAEPMKDGNDIYDSDTSETTRHIPEANFDLIHQYEWEDDILWDSSKRDELTSRHCQLIEVDSENEHNLLPDVHSERLTMDQHVATGLRDHPYVVEPLCQSFNGIEDVKVAHHSQVLRLETRVFDLESVEEARAQLLKRICSMTRKVKEKNREIASGDWLSSLSWGELEPSMPRVKVILDFMDPQMVFEDHTSEAMNGQSLCFHAAAVVLAAGGTHGAGDVAAEGSVHAPLSLTRFNISNDKYYTNKKTHQQLKSNAKKRAIHGVKVMHSLPAIKLQSMKPKLSNKDLANFHRPKASWYPHHNEVAAKEQGKLASVGRMTVIVKTLGAKGTKLAVDASETLTSLKAKSAKKLGDVKPSEKTKVYYSGKELNDGQSFYQQQVLPNSVLHLVRTRIFPWPKAQRLPGENKPLRPPGAFKKKSELSVKDGHVALMEYCEERPLLLGNVGMGGRLFTYYRKRSPTDATAATLRAERGPWVGITLPLEPTEDSPFLGDIRPGDTQSSLETSMYRAPVFPHKLSTTDFLLVRSSKGKLSLRRIDSVHVVGQQEPHMEVLTPTSKSVQNYLGNRLMVYLYREFREKEKPDMITPHVRADDVISQFPTLTEGFIRKRLKHCADLQKIGGEMCWVMRRNFRIPSEEEMRRLVTPENVCTYESMQAGQHHLKRMGVHKLTQPSGLASAMNQLPDEAITIAAASHIERELQITPWNLSSNFVAATMQGRGSLERLEIVGAGDPSGRGLGFSYLRVATKPPNAGALVEKKAAAARGGGAVTGTDADLRRLSMEAAREVLLKFKVPEEIIDKLTRWHRIAMVRKLSSEQAASGVKLGAAVLNKFARGQRMSFLQLQQQTREKCQDIWDKQVQSLSMPDGDDSGSDGEAGGDLDSFAGDLENLLEAEEGDQGGVKKGKREGIGGLGARRRKQIAQEEEDIEDEEAEAAELRRMLRADDEAEEEQKKKKSVSGRKEKKAEEVEIPFDLDRQSFDQKSATITHPGHKSGDGQAGKKKKRILKRIIRTRKPDGSYSSKEILITDPKEVALYLAKKNASKILHEKAGADKDDSQKRTIGRTPLSSKKVKSVPTTEMSAKGKVNRKFGRDALSLVCGACGQLGHMRTNKKCPLYNEEGGENVAWQDSGAAGAATPVDGSLERQGTRITIKRKSVSTKYVEEEPEPVEPPPPPPAAIITPAPTKQEFPLPPTPSVAKTPSLKMKIKLVSANQNLDSAVMPAPLPPVENIESEDTPMWKTPRPVIKLKLSNQKQKEQSGAKRVKEDGDAAWEPDRERGKQRVVHEEAEKERRQRERKLERESTYVFNDTDAPREDVFSFPPKVVVKKQKTKLADGSDLLLRRKRQREAEEYQLALDEELKREQEELERKEEERPRKEQCKVGRERTHRQPIKEKEKDRRRREDEPWRAPKETSVDVERVPRDGMIMKRERSDMVMHKKTGHMNKLTRLVSGDIDRPPKVMKFRPDPPSVSYRPPPEFGSAPKRLRKKGGEVDLCNILEDVVEILKNADCAYLFLKPVPKKEAPDYLHYVKRPMDLFTIRDRVRKLKYRSREDFRNDVRQIADNAHLYNDGRNPGIPPLADRLLELCDRELVARDDDLCDAEAGIELVHDDSFTCNSPTFDHRRRSVRMF